jgi:MFS family permease
VSFANDLASELLYPVLPLFLTVTLGAPVAVLGVIEGIAEGAAVGLRGAAGWLSDRWGGRRVAWIRSGYGLTAASRPILAAAPAWGWVLAARLVDKAGKATRTAPRDALIRASTPDKLVGSAFGYHRAFDTAGAVGGPLVAVGLLALGASLRDVLWVAAVAGALTLVLLVRIREARPAEGPVGPVETVERAERLPRAFWVVLSVWVVFSLGNSSDVFVLLRARDLGLSATLVVLAYAIYNIVYSGLSWPFGSLSDLVPRTWVLGAGLATFALVYAGLALASASWAVWPLLAVYGVYVAATEGVARAWVADHAPARALGTAFGVFSAATGAALLVASVTAGVLWSAVGPSAPFWFGAAAATAALALLAVTSRRGRT